MQNLKRYTMLAAVALLAACGGGDDKDPAGPGGENPGGENPGSTVGSFTANATGDLAASFSGSAVHASVSQGEDQGFAIALDDTPSAGTATAGIIFVRQNPAIPGAGSHQIVTLDEQSSASEFVTIAAVTDSEGSQWICTASSASTLTISSSSSSRVKGSFNIPMECQSGETGEVAEVTFKGSFDTRTGNIE